MKTAGRIFFKMMYSFGAFFVILIGYFAFVLVVEKYILGIDQNAPRPTPAATAMIFILPAWRCIWTDGLTAMKKVKVWAITSLAAFGVGFVITLIVGSIFFKWVAANYGIFFVASFIEFGLIGNLAGFAVGELVVRRRIRAAKA